MKARFGWTCAICVVFLFVNSACRNDSGGSSTGQDASTAQDASGPADSDVASDSGPADASTVQDAGDGGVPPLPWRCPGNEIPVTGVAEQTDILAAIQSAAEGAADGDCIVLPAGEYYAEGEIVITKMVSLLGHGAADGGTWIRRAETYPESTLSGQGMIRYDINSRTPSHVVIAGIRFSSKIPQEMGGTSGSLATDYGLKLSGLVDFVITDCRFENFGYAGIQIKHFDDLARGLIYNCEFFHNAKGDGQGLGYGVVFYGENNQWVEDPQFGSDNFIFVEDCQFVQHRHALAAGGAARYVIRYSEIVDCPYKGACIDAHEGRAGSLGHSNYFATRALEAYGNEIRADHFSDGTPIAPGGDLNNLNLVAIGIRGGEALIHDNHISNILNGMLFIVFDSQQSTWDDYAYPYPYQIGWQSGEALGENHSGTGPEERKGDIFEWNNVFIPYAPTGQERKFWLDSSSQLSGALREGRDYHIETPRPDYTPYPYPHPARIDWQGLPDR